MCPVNEHFQHTNNYAPTMNINPTALLTAIALTLLPACASHRPKTDATPTSLQRVTIPVSGTAGQPNMRVWRFDRPFGQYFYVKSVPNAYHIRTDKLDDYRLRITFGPSYARSGENFSGGIIYDIDFR